MEIGLLLACPVGERLSSTLTDMTRFRIATRNPRLLFAPLVVAASFLCAVAADAQMAEPGCTVEVSTPGTAVAPICRGQQLEEFNDQF